MPVYGYNALRALLKFSSWRIQSETPLHQGLIVQRSTLKAREYEIDLGITAGEDASGDQQHAAQFSR